MFISSFWSKSLTWIPASFPSLLVPYILPFISLCIAFFLPFATNNHNCQKIKLHGSPTTNELKRNIHPLNKFLSTEYSIAIYRYNAEQQMSKTFIYTYGTASPYLSLPPALGYQHPTFCYCKFDYYMRYQCTSFWNIKTLYFLAGPLSFQWWQTALMLKTGVNVVCYQTKANHGFLWVQENILHTNFCSEFSWDTNWSLFTCEHSDSFTWVFFPKFWACTSLKTLQKLQS